MLTATEVITASARSGWSPGIDLRLVSEPSKGIFAVADGSGPTYGGHHEPRSLDPAVVAMQDILLANGAPGLRDAIGAAQRSAFELQSSERADPGPRDFEHKRSHCGVGVTVAALQDGALHGAQVGMSRLYRKRRENINLLMLDHSLPSMFLRQHGPTSPEYLQALSSHRSAVARVLGLSPNVDADYIVEPVEDGDAFLICSSAIWNHEQGDNTVRGLLDARPENFQRLIEGICSRQDVGAIRFRTSRLA